MNLDKKYEDLLLAIYSSDKERLLPNEIAEKEKLGDQEIGTQLDFLIEVDLVEYDENENAYYLTFEGYEKVEEIQKMIEVGQAMANLEFESSSPHPIYKRIKTLAFTLCLLLAGYVYFTTVVWRDNASIDLSNGFPENIKDEIRVKLDSALNSKETVEKH